MEEENKTQQTERSRYRNSFGATLLFSVVQIYQILIKIIKSKFVALFIGPAGMGIQSLFYSTTETISAATNLGLNTSSVKTIAAANGVGDKELLAKNVIVQRRLIWITGLMGMLICALLSPIWSQTSFGNYDYIWAFVIVSSIILFDQLNRGALALLQGMQLKKQLARANVIGQTLNAIITIPLYYYWGIKAIVVAIVLGSLQSLLISHFYSKKIIIPKIKITWNETFIVGQEMIKLGFFLSLQSVMSTFVIWMIRNYVSNLGGVEDVGLYSAGTVIVGSYIGLVFAAITTDYFPRLAATKNFDEMTVAVRTQAELTILMLAPLAVAFLVFCKPIIILLYSNKFLPIEHMMYWSIGAVLLQAMGWAASYTILAKAKPSVFLLNELITTAWGLPIKIICYKYWGLTGFGIATMIVWVLYLIQVLLVTKKLFGITYEFSLWKIFLILNAPIILTLLIKFLMSEYWGYIGGTVILFITSGYSLYKLNQRMDLKSFLRNRLNKQTSK